MIFPFEYRCLMKGLPRLHTLTWASHKCFPTPQPSFSLCRSRTQRNRSRESLDTSLSDNSVQVRCYRGLIERESKKLFSLTGATWRTPVIRERSRSSTLLPSVPSPPCVYMRWLHGASGKNNALFETPLLFWPAWPTNKREGRGGEVIFGFPWITLYERSLPD